MHDLEYYKDYLETSFAEDIFPQHPKSLYEPLRYILTLGGKRMRPVLTLMSCAYFEGSYQKALAAAMAVELFHNFSLIHDDIMDEAPLRRGKQTVHEKWDVNTGILSGDAMLIMAYRYFESYEPPLFRELAKLFSKTALEVCEGQQFDMDFETRSDVSIPEYIKMIEYKTAVLVGASLQMGAMVAQADLESQNHIYEFGRNLGIAFQLQDDYLDAFGDPEHFGKQVGGDILANKKTYLYLKSLELGDPSSVESLKYWFETKVADSDKKIAAVKEIFQKTGAVPAIEGQIESYTNTAFSHLDALRISEKSKEKLREFGRYLMHRTF